MNQYLHHFLVTVGLFASLVMSSPLAAQQQSATGPRLQALNVSVLGANVLIRLDTDRPFSQTPSGFAIAQPPRVVVDLHNATNGLGRKSQKVGQGILSRIDIVEAGGRIRLVFNLSKSANYMVSRNGRSLEITLTPTATTSAVSGAATPPAIQSAQNETRRIQRVDFKRTKDGSGRVLVDLSHPSISVTVRRSGNSLLADFSDVTLPGELHKTLDVSSFATVVQTITTAPRDTGVRLKVKPGDASWDFTAYQTDTQYVIEFREKKRDTNRLFDEEKLDYKGPKVSINFQNGDVRGLLRLMAEELGFNAVISDTVTGKATLVLKNVPADQVMAIIFKQKGLGLRRNGNVVLIAPQQELSAGEQETFERERRRERVEPLYLETFQINYQKADVIARILTGSSSGGSTSSTNTSDSEGLLGAASGNQRTAGSGSGGTRILSARGTASSETRTNLLFVKDTEKSLQQVRVMLGRIDVPPRQVMIEARIVEAKNEFAKALGIRMGYFNRAYAKAGDHLRVGGDLTDVTYGTRQQVDAQPTYNAGGLSVNLPQTVPSGASLGSIAFSLFNKSLTEFLNLELTALETDGQGKVISSPRVMTTNQEEAVIEQGVSIPYATESSSDGVTTTTITYQEVKLMLKVKPLITPNGRVQLDIDINKDTPGTETTAGFQIDTKHIETQAMIDNGGTIAIGGIYTDTQRRSVSKVPFFGDLPLVGGFFRNKQIVHDKNELIVFISPRVVTDVSLQ